MKDCFITLQEAAEQLGVCSQSVRGLIQQKIINARQTVSCAPWIIQREELEKEEVKIAVNGIKNGTNRRNIGSRCDNQIKIFQ
jgi:predicted transcriptional regulator